MYKFTNGIVVFDRKTKDEYLNAGYKLLKEKKDNYVENVTEINNENCNESIEEEHTKNNTKIRKGKK